MEFLGGGTLTLDAIKTAYNDTKTKFKKSMVEIESLHKNPELCTVESTFIAIDECYGKFKNEVSLFILLQQIHKDANIRKLSEKISIECAELNDEYVSRGKIYLSCNNVFMGATPEYYIASKKLDPHTKKLILDQMLQFKHAGCGNKKRDTLVLYNKKLTELIQTFSNNIKSHKLHAKFSIKELDNVANKLKKHAVSKTKNSYILNLLDAETTRIVLGDCDNENTRKKYYTLMKSTSNGNDVIMPKILKYRTKIAELLGYDNWESMTLVGTLMDNEMALHKFLGEFDHKYKYDARRTHIRINHGYETNDYNVLYNRFQHTKQSFTMNTDAIKEYLVMSHVFDTVLDVFSEIFLLKFKKVRPEFTWCDEEIFCYDVYDNNKTKDHIGRIYFDLYPREHKYNHAMCSSVVARNRHDPELINTCFIVTNFDKPLKTNTISETNCVTFMHEFGHALHHICGANKESYYMQSGLNGGTFDFVEAPSQLLENWFYTPEFLKKVSRHYITGASFTDDQIDDIINKYEFYRPIKWYDQYLYANWDCNIHCEPSTYKKMAKMFSYNPFFKKTISNNNSMQTFGHFAEYDGKYYTYLLSVQISDKMYLRFIKGEYKKICKRYREKVLDVGGSLPAKKIIASFFKKE